MTLLAIALVVGLCAAGATLVVRAVVPQLWLMVKPFACDLCMSWWSSLVASVVVGGIEGRGALTAMVSALAGTAVSVVILKAVNRLDDRV